MNIKRDGNESPRLRCLRPILLALTFALGAAVISLMTGVQPALKPASG